MSPHTHPHQTHTWNAIKNICNQVRMHVFPNSCVKDARTVTYAYDNIMIIIFVVVFVTGAFGDRLLQRPAI